MMLVGLPEVTVVAIWSRWRVAPGHEKGFLVAEEYPTFTERAPAEVVTRTQNRQETAAQNINRLSAQLAALPT